MKYTSMAAAVAVAVAVGGCPSGGAKAPVRPSDGADPAGDDPSEFSQLARDAQALIRPLIEDDWLVGVSVGLIRIGDQDIRRIFYDAGRVSSGGGTPSRNTVYEIGSVSKVFTGLLLAILAEAETVRLSEPVSALLPDTVRVPDKGGVAITLAHLATHTSGLPRMPANFAPADPENPYADYSVDALYEALGTVELSATPGEKYEYSNLGAGLLGHALALRAGRSYEDAVAEWITGPLGMDSTSIELSADQRGRLARGHDADGMPVPGWDLPTLAGAGALRSTARDMLAFVEANLRLDHSELAAALRSTHAPRADADAGGRIALGWHVMKVPPAKGKGGGARAEAHSVLWHNGQTGGYHSLIGFDPTRRIGVVVLANSGAGVVDALGFSLMKMLVGEPYELDLPEMADVDPAVLARYVGKYKLPIGMVLDVTVEGDKLFIQATGQPRFRVYPSSETRFYWRVVEASIEFRRDASGAVTGAEVDQGGAKMKAEKVE